MKLMEECAGIGEIVFEGRSRPVAYRVQRHQGVMAGSGLPIPGLHRLEGAVTTPVKRVLRVAPRDVFYIETVNSRYRLEVRDRERTLDDASSG
jgi:hypothetical protein